MLLACSTALFGADLPLPASSPLLNTAPALQDSGTNAVLPANVAFPLTALVETDGSITLLWELAPHYYLYRKSLAVTKPDGAALMLELPEPTTITDEFFGEVAVYYERLRVSVPATELAAAPGNTVVLQLEYQGCVEDQYCYPLQQKTLSIQLP